MRICLAYGIYAAIPLVLTAICANAAPLAPQKASDVITLASSSASHECTPGSTATQIADRQKGDGTIEGSSCRRKTCTSCRAGTAASAHACQVTRKQRTSRPPRWNTCARSIRRSAAR